MPANLCLTGEVFQASEAERRAKPRLSLFNVSMNSQKGHLFCRLSTRWQEMEINTIMFPEENQSLEYARLNPFMTVPVLEIDDKIICDSLETMRYLREKFPGPGDLAAPAQEQDVFVDKCQVFDEGLFTYRRMGAAGSVANELRQLRLREALQDALGIRQGGSSVACLPCSGQREEGNKTGEDKSGEVLRHGKTVLETYVKKIAQIYLIEDAGSGEMTEAMQKRIDDNDACLSELFAEVDRMLQRSKGKFLFSDNLSSADAFWICIVFRANDCDADLVKNYHTKFPRVGQYWEDFAEMPESEVILPYGMNWAKMRGLRSGVVAKVLGLKLGILKAPVLPDRVEAMVQDELKKMKEDYYAA